MQQTDNLAYPSLYLRQTRHHLQPIPPPHQTLFLYQSAAHRHLHSFPTRRSSDLFCSPLEKREPLLSAPPTFRFREDRKSTRLNSSHVEISYAVFCLKKKTDLPSRTTRSRNLSETAEVRGCSVPSRSPVPAVATTT